MKHKYLILATLTGLKCLYIIVNHKCLVLGVWSVLRCCTLYVLCWVSGVRCCTLYWTGGLILEGSN